MNSLCTDAHNLDQFAYQGSASQALRQGSDALLAAGGQLDATLAQMMVPAAPPNYANELYASYSGVKIQFAQLAQCQALTDEMAQGELSRLMALVNLDLGQIEQQIFAE